MAFCFERQYCKESDADFWWNQSDTLMEPMDVEGIKIYLFILCRLFWLLAGQIKNTTKSIVAADGFLCFFINQVASFCGGGGKISYIRDDILSKIFTFCLYYLELAT